MSISQVTANANTAGMEREDEVVKALQEKAQSADQDMLKAYLKTLEYMPRNAGGVLEKRIEEKGAEEAIKGLIEQRPWVLDFRQVSVSSAEAEKQEAWHVYCKATKNALAARRELQAATQLKVATVREAFI